MVSEVRKIKFTKEKKAGPYWFHYEVYHPFLREQIKITATRREVKGEHAAEVKARLTAALAFTIAAQRTGLSSAHPLAQKKLKELFKKYAAFLPIERSGKITEREMRMERDRLKEKIMAGLASVGIGPKTFLGEYNKAVEKLREE